MPNANGSKGIVLHKREKDVAKAFRREAKCSKRKKAREEIEIYY